MKKLEGRVAAVTGAAQGIGFAIAQRLAADGANTVLLDTDEQALNKAGERLKDYNIQCRVCNVADAAAVQEVFAGIQRERGGVDILVNNAAITRDAMYHKMSEESWQAVLDVNIGGVHHCCSAVLPGMRQQKYGKIVNLASVSAFGNLGQTNYGMSKAAVIGFTKCLAKETARLGITVNAVAPSYVDTEMLRSVPGEVLERFKAAVPMGRLASPAEIAAVVAFLSCEDSSFVTGECIVASGGSYM